MAVQTGEIGPFQGILLHAKFNRFFIILGGVAGRPKSWIFLNFHDFGVWRGPIYWDFGEKYLKNPDTSSAFFVDF